MNVVIQNARSGITLYEEMHTTLSGTTFPCYRLRAGRILPAHLAEFDPSGRGAALIAFDQACAWVASHPAAGDGR